MAPPSRLCGISMQPTRHPTSPMAVSVCANRALPRIRTSSSSESTTGRHTTSGNNQQEGIVSQEIQKWADKAMFEAEPIAHKEGEAVHPKVYLIEATVDPLGSIAAACKMYKGEVARDKAGISNKER